MLEVDAAPKNGVRLASSAFAGFQRSTVAVSLAVFVNYYLNLGLDALGLGPPPDVALHMDVIVTALCSGALAALGKKLRDRGVESVV